MPTLNWIGKEKVVNHHRDVPFRVLEHQYGFSAETGETKEPTGSGNMIIHGDNLEALKALLPEYEGKVKCIYIDPPYNTGEEKWVYNDNVNHPKIKKWLGEVVGKEEDDLSRHDKWLCMMYPRLRLLHRLLSPEGVIFISIDDYEYHNLTSVTNEIFGVRNKLATIIWDLGTGTQAGHFVRAHEYILCYSKNKSLLPNFKGGEGIIKHSALKKISVKNPSSSFTFPKGTRFDAPDGTTLNGSWGGSERTTLIDGVMKAENGKLVDEVTLSAGWAMKSQMQNWFFVNSEETYDTKGQKVSEFYFNSSGVLTYIKEKSVTNPPTVLRQIANTKSGSAELRKILGTDKFNFPKPSDLISFLIKLITKDNDIVLDSFAGTGTTGHAVLKQNAEDGSSRKFILIELEDYANDVTAERNKRVIKGVEDLPPLGGSFDFYELGKPLFIGENKEHLNESVGIEKIRQYIWYSETRTSFYKPHNKIESEHYLGKQDQTAYYFYYEPDEITTLDHDFLATIKTKAEQYVIYADNCLLSKEFMAKHNIIFKKIPRDITRF